MSLPSQPLTDTESDIYDFEVSYFLKIYRTTFQTGIVVILLRMSSEI